MGPFFWPQFSRTESLYGRGERQVGSPAIACVSIRMLSLAYAPCSDLTKCSDVSHPADTF